MSSLSALRKAKGLKFSPTKSPSKSPSKSPIKGSRPKTSPRIEYGRHTVVPSFEKKRLSQVYLFETSTSSSSASASEIYIIHREQGGQMRTEIMKIFPIPKSISKLESNAAAKSLLYEINIYKNVIRDINVKNLSRNFVKYETSGADLTFEQVLRFIGIKNVDNLYRNVHYQICVRENKDKLEDAAKAIDPTFKRKLTRMAVTSTTKTEKRKSILISDAAYQIVCGPVTAQVQDNIRNNYLFGYVITQKSESATFYSWLFNNMLGVSDFTDATINSFWQYTFQILYSLNILNNIYRVNHNDLHIDNILMDKISTPFFPYCIYVIAETGEIACINTMLVPKIFDFDFSYQEGKINTKLETGDYCKEYGRCNRFLPQIDVIKFCAELYDVFQQHIEEGIKAGRGKLHQKRNEKIIHIFSDLITFLVKPEAKLATMQIFNNSDQFMRVFDASGHQASPLSNWNNNKEFLSGFRDPQNYLDEMKTKIGNSNNFTNMIQSIALGLVSYFRQTNNMAAISSPANIKQVLKSPGVDFDKSIYVNILDDNRRAAIIDKTLDICSEHIYNSVQGR